MLSYLNPLPSLPEYSGPHKVGTAEFEIPVSEISSATNVPDPDITTVKFRLYYPTSSNAKSKKPVRWLPEPQNEWNEAYASFMGASSRYSSIMSMMLGMWNYATLPVVKDAKLSSPTKPSGHPLCIFSHGLGGNFNTYSSVVGNLASSGLFCVAPEHRDGSAPISLIKNVDGKIIKRIHYRRYSHSPTPEVINSRNAQLRIRLWELEMIYTAIKAMNDGQQFTNYADNELEQSFQQQLNLAPGQVTWAGHSFGACTMTQFVKSVFYHEHLPQNSASHSTDPHLRPLLQVSSTCDLVSQITPQSPVALLDLWTMPLRSEVTKWLWERPLPSYHRSPLSSSQPSTVAVISAEFYKWEELLNRTRATLSRDPVAAWQDVDKHDTTPTLINDTTKSQNPIPELNKQEEIANDTEVEQTVSPMVSAGSSRSASPARSDSIRDSAGTSQTSLVPSEHDFKTLQGIAPHLYLVPQSAHLSQSDFGVLFPSLTKYVMKAIEPRETIDLNVRAVLAAVRSVGHDVGLADDRILDPGRLEKINRWISVPLVPTS